jgi:hypothetical protein
MVAILAKLEPRMEPEGKVLFNAVDEVEEIFFIT